MKRLSSALTLALALVLILSAQPLALAQNSAAAKAQTQSAGKYEKQVRLFDEFARKQMALDKTVGMTIGFMKDDFVWVKGY
ncbi:MAG TPA: hypothetical protein VJS64_02825, partial [Pyrinomonadaceae bacterium]|nr:hypothetical protein [Pyrinomonadaceae bacterium]